MAAIEPYKFKPNVLQTQNVIAEKIVKWIISCVLQVFLLAATFELDGMTSNQTRPGCQVRRATSIFWTSFETKLFRIAGTSILEAETSGIKKKPVFTCYRWRQKASVSEWPSPLTGDSLHSTPARSLATYNDVTSLSICKVQKGSK